MAKATFVQKGNNIDYVPAEDVAYMDVVPLKNRIGVALEDIKAGETGSVTLTGVFDIPAGNGAIDAGAAVFYDTDAEKIVAASGANTVEAGYTVEAKTAAATVARVKIG